MKLYSELRIPNSALRCNTSTRFAPSVALGAKEAGCGSLSRECADGSREQGGVAMLQLKKRSAFTLIELLVVVIIVAILAAVGVPMLSANVQRARASEAEAGLGTVRTALRAYFAENQTYVGAALTNIIGLNVDQSGAGSLDDDLDGRWFSDDAYALGGLSSTGFCIRVNGAASAAPRADQVDGIGSNPVIIRTMNQDGQLRANGSTTCTGGTVLN